MQRFLVLQNTEEKFQKNILNERIARLSAGIAILQVILKYITVSILRTGESGGFDFLPS